MDYVGRWTNIPHTQQRVILNYYTKLLTDPSDTRKVY